MLRDKRYILLVLGALWSMAVWSQPRLRVKEYYFGAHGGVSASSVLFSPTVDNMSPITNASVLGGSGGLVFRYAGHKYCAVQLELNYQHKGWAERNDTIGRYSRSLHYLEIPLLMHLNFGSERCRWILNLGPQIGYCVKDEGNKGTLLNGASQIEYGALEHPFDWGLLVGTGISIRSRKAGIFELEARFDYSLGGIYGTGLIDHFSMASPMDLSIHVAYMWKAERLKTR